MGKNLIFNLVKQRFYSSLVPVEELPIVSLPYYVKQHIERQKKKVQLKQLQVVKVKPRGGNKAFPLITGQKAEFDFYLGQTYPSNCRIPLISEHWMKKNTSGQKFTIHKQSENPALPTLFNRPGIGERFQFSQFGLKEEIITVLADQGITYPSLPQTKVIPKILDKKNVLFVAECGSGKSLGYLVPILQSLLNLKAKIPCRTNSPLAVVVVPGKELAEQIAQQAYSLGSPCGIDARVLVAGGTSIEHLVPKDNTNVDLLVGTFGILDKLFKRKIFSMAHVNHVILDEADTLLDDSFNQDILQFLQYLMAYNDETLTDLDIPNVQLVLVSCTWPSNFEHILSEIIPVEQMEKVVSPYAHRLMPHVIHRFERVRHSVRAGVLLEYIKADVRKKVPAMIFTNQSPTCDWMSHFLEDNNVPHAKFHAGISIRKRTAAFNDFKDGFVNVLCCTDLGSRGLDVQQVKHVINFDFPNNMSDYIHRSGRIGRLGTNHGYVTSFVNDVPGAAVVQQIEMAIRQSTGLPAIDANIKRKIEKLKLISQYSH